MKFIIDNLEPGLILAGRNEHSRFGKGIRACLGSFTNHNGLFVKDEKVGWCVGEAIQPVSCLTPVASYQRECDHHGYEVRVWRVKAADDDSRAFAAYYFAHNLLGLRYADHSIAKLALFRIVNNIPWRLHIHGVWCTELVQMAWTEATKKAKDNPFLKPNGKMKKNPTPRTVENRLVAGVLEDVTDHVVDPET